MSEQTRTVNKSYFETGDTPTEAQFINLIDSCQNRVDDVSDRYIKVELSSAQILSSFSSPVEVIPTPGAGKVIVPNLMVYDFTYVSSTYATNVNSGIVYNGETTRHFQIGINSGSSEIIIIPVDSGNPLIANTAMDFYTLTGNPTAGDGTITLHIWYKILTL